MWETAMLNCITFLESSDIILTSSISHCLMHINKLMINSSNNNSQKPLVAMVTVLLGKISPDIILPNEISKLSKQVLMLKFMISNITNKDNTKPIYFKIPRDSNKGPTGNISIYDILIIKGKQKQFKFNYIISILGNHLIRLLSDKNRSLLSCHMFDIGMINFLDYSNLLNRRRVPFNCS